MNASTAGPDPGSALSTAIHDLSGTLQSAITAALVTAVIVYCAVELIKLPLRANFNFLMFTLWKRQLLISAGGTIKFPPMFLPPDLFLKYLENRARAAMEGGSNGDELAAFGSGAPLADITLILNQSKAHAQTSTTARQPTEAEMPDPVVAQLASAQSNVASTIERNLDALQISMSFWWPRTVQTAAILISVGIVLTFARTVEGFKSGTALLLVISVVGAYMASILRDILGIIYRLRGR